MIIVSNNNLIEVIGRRPLTEAFQAADNVLRQGVQTITDLIAVPAMINLDFADVRTIMENQGSALIGIGMAEGEDKARVAAEKAIQSPLLEVQIAGARNAIVNITGGESITLFDAEDAMALIREAAGNDVDVILVLLLTKNLVIPSSLRLSQQVLMRKMKILHLHRLLSHSLLSLPDLRKFTQLISKMKMMIKVFLLSLDVKNEIILY